MLPLEKYRLLYTFTWFLDMEIIKDISYTAAHSSKILETFYFPLNYLPKAIWGYLRQCVCILYGKYNIERKLFLHFEHF
jgi:hypothetical protein